MCVRAVLKSASVDTTLYRSVSRSLLLLSLFLARPPNRLALHFVAKQFVESNHSPARLHSRGLRDDSILIESVRFSLICIATAFTDKKK